MNNVISQLGTSTVLILATIFLLSSYALYLWVFKTTKKFPPGPREWGTTLAIFRATKTESVHILATEWAKKYGPMTFLNYMGQRILFLNNTDISRRVLASDDYKLLVADRVASAPTNIRTYNGKDWVFTPYDKTMRKKRRLFHKVISLYGDEIEKFENVVSGEMDRLMAELEQSENKDIELWKYLARSLKIIIYILIVGERPDDINKMDILEEYDMAFNKLVSPEFDFLLSKFPFLAKFPGKFKNAVDRLINAKTGAEELVYFAPKRTWIPGQPRGIADQVFDFQNQPNYQWMKNDPEHTIAFLTTLFWTAHLTTRGSVLGVFLCLINYPAVTKKLQEEIDQMIGDRLPKLKDKSNMPYTEATIFEVLRLITQITQELLPRTFKLMLLINTWHLHHNEDIWEDPWTFKPERFLNDQGQLLPIDHPVRRNLLPFGAGVRSCPGEIFARSRVFMYVTHILQKFDVLPPASEKLMAADFCSNHELVKGHIRQVQPYKCRLQRRNAKSL